MNKCTHEYIKKKENDQTIFIHVYTLECIRPSKGGKRAIGTSNRNKNSVREHSRISTGQDTRECSIRNISEREKDRRNKMCVCLSTKKRQPDTSSTTKKKKKE